MRKTQLKSMKNEVDKVLSEAKAMAFIQVVRRHEGATLGDVMALAKEMDLTHLDIGQILFTGLPKDGKGWAKKMRALGPGGSQAPANGMETRTAKGRAAYDEAILKVVQKAKKWKSAIEIRASVGGSPEQARRSLNRLIERGLINFEGKARATRYQAT